MGKKIQGAKLRALKRSKVIVDELQERQAEDAVLVHTEDLFVIDRTGTSHIPHHLRPSKVVLHKASIGTKNAKFARNHLSSIDEQKVQKLLLQKQSAPQQRQRQSKNTNSSTAVVERMSTNRRHKTTSIQRQTVNFDLWQEEDQSNVKIDTLKTTATRVSKVNSSAMDTSSDDKVATVEAMETTSIVPRAVKFTAEGIRNIVVSTATAIKDGIWNRLMTQTTPAGIAPVHVVTKGLPTRISNKIKNPVITKVVGTTKHLIPIAKKKVAIDTSLTGGQSYHPDPVQHQQLLQTAIQIEVARNKAIADAITPISKGLSAETRAILMKDDSEEEDDDEEEDAELGDDPTSMAVGDVPKRLNKLTTAQRNKQKLRRQQETILRKQKKAKKLLNDGEIPKYQKDLKRQQRTSTEKQLQKIQQLQTKLETNPLGSKLEIIQSQANPILAPTFPIALPQPQSSSSLRTIQPKGSMITDRAFSLSSRHPSISPVIPTKRDLNATNNNSKSGSTSRSSMMMMKLAPHKHRKKRKLSMKGKRNSSTRGEDFEILG